MGEPTYMQGAKDNRRDPVDHRCVECGGPPCSCAFDAYEYRIRTARDRGDYPWKMFEQRRKIR